MPAPRRPRASARPTSAPRRTARRVLGVLGALAVVTGTATALAGPAAAAGPGPVHLPQRPVLRPTPPAAVLPFVRARTGSTPLLFLGDSLAEGWNATSPEATFPSVVSGALAAGGPVDPHVVARAGYGVAALTAITDVPARTGLVVVELGTNDVPRQVDPDQFEADYRALTAKVRAAAPRTALVCLGTWRPDGTRWDARVRAACRAAGGTYVPLADLYVRPELHGTGSGPHFVGLLDWFHPDDEGYAVIAGRVVDATR